MALDVFQDLFTKEEISNQKILHDLLESKTGLNMKTEIVLPVEITAWDVYAHALEYYFKKAGLKNSNSVQIMKDFSFLFKEHMVSHKRQSRKEITDAIKGLLSETRNRSLLDKLTGMGKER
jgi:hypothetical protein